MQTTSERSSETGATPTGDLRCEAPTQAIPDRRIEFESLLARDLPRLRKLAIRWLRNREDAEDAVQDAVLSAFTHLASFEGRAQMSSWLMSIVINSLKMQLRRKKRKILLLDQFAEDGVRTVAETISDPRPNPEQRCQSSELYEILTRSIGKLSATQRTALRLFQLRGLSLKEAAQTLGVSVGTVKAQLARGRRQLAQDIQKIVRPRTESCCVYSAERQGGSQKRSRSKAPLRGLPEAAEAGTRGQVADDNMRTGVIRGEIGFPVMEVAVDVCLA